MRRIIVNYDVKENTGRDLVKAFLASDAVKRVREEEGCLQYEYYVSAENPDKVILVELWETAEDHLAHKAGANMAALADVKKPYVKAQTVEIFDK